MTKKEASAILTLVSLGYMVQRPNGQTISPEVKASPTPKPATTLAERTATILDDPKAPHGRDAEGNPLAPHGWLADGSRPRKSAAGRPTGPTPQAAPKTPKVSTPKTPQAAPGGFSLDLSDFGGEAPAAPEPTATSVLDELEMDLGGLGGL